MKENGRAAADPQPRSAGAILAERPAYDGGSIVNLMASLVAASGGEPRYAPLHGLEPGRLSDARNIVLIVVDGLGYDFLRSSRAGRVMRGSLRQRLTSVYPPTTATAITTFLTGLAPQQHGLTGWYMYFKELGSVVAVLPFVTRLGRMPLASAGVSARALLGHTSVFDGIQRTAVCVSPSDIAGSEFNRAHTGRAAVRAYGSLRELVASIDAAVHEAVGPAVVYAYWPELDRLAHANGIASAAAQAHLEELDAAYEELLARLAGTDSIVLLTADHGFVDVAREAVVRVERHPPLAEALAAPLCGEPRTAYCYVAPRHERRFLDYVRETLGDVAQCVESSRLVDEGYFGSGSPHPRLLDRIGTHALLMRDLCAIQDVLPGESGFEPRGMHGGGSGSELHVPLLVAEA